MHLKSLTLKGFKSFPERTRLDFSPGVAVIVGPNGSGKSNITDAILWVLGEQSPLTIRGQSMQDVIFAGGHGVQARSSAEVELVLDNSEEKVDLPFSEVSISRRLNNNGDGEYRINGARCRLIDVMEILSDTGLGKEMHSVISQGRVEALITSKPRDRRLLIEEAAGLGKHRKRRRQAQLKLERTELNLSRALDVEQEARSRLRPLKRQAEAAELHERLERQSDEARWGLAREVSRLAQISLDESQGRVDAARGASEQAEQELRAVAKLREGAESALTARSAERESISNRYYTAKSNSERIALRQEGVQRRHSEILERSARRRTLLETLENERGADTGDDGAEERIAALQNEIDQLDRDREERLALEIAELEERRTVASAHAEKLESEAAAATEARKEAERQADGARKATRDAQVAADTARRDAARVGAELAAVNQFLRSNAGAPGGASALADCITADSGFELALSAALGPTLRAAVASDMSEAQALLDRSGRDGGTALVQAQLSKEGGSSAEGVGRKGESEWSPPAGVESLLSHVHSEGDSSAWELAQTLLTNIWVVDSFDQLDDQFDGIAVTKSGRVWSPNLHELRQVPAGGEDRVFAERNRRDQLVEQSAKAVQAEHAAIAALEKVADEVAMLDSARAEAESSERLAIRAGKEAAEQVRHITWLMEQRRTAPDEGSSAKRKTELSAALVTERRLIERTQRERHEREQRITREESKLRSDQVLAPLVQEIAEGLAEAAVEVKARLELLENELHADREVGEKLASELRAHAAQENQVQSKLKACSEEVTRSEVQAQQLRDRFAEAQQTLNELAEKLGLEAESAEEALSDEERAALEQRIERLRRRREQLGPVNPLAQQEYTEALEHVAELEGQREDLESALRELRGLIRDTDKRIADAFEETFTTAARNFIEVVPLLFPGGRGQLKLTTTKSEDQEDQEGEEGASEGEETSESTTKSSSSKSEKPQLTPSLHENMGIEIEITPVGKSAKPLSLLSGGEKSLTALAFLFAVFLARPCPFYVLDEVEAALDDLNLGRFIELLRRFSNRAQFIVVTHQRRTMEVADCLYGVSMAGNGVSKVVSRRLEAAKAEELSAP